MFFRWKNYLFSCFLSLFCTWIILETKGETAKCNNLLLGQYPFDDDVKSFLFQLRMFSIMSVVFKEHDIFPWRFLSIFVLIRKSTHRLKQLLVVQLTILLKVKIDIVIAAWTLELLFRGKATLSMTGSLGWCRDIYAIHAFLTHKFEVWRVVSVNSC